MARAFDGRRDRPSVARPGEQTVVAVGRLSSLKDGLSFDRAPPFAETVQRRSAEAQTFDASGIVGPGRPPRTGALPAALRAEVEARSGFALDDVRVHRNSPQPARIGAVGYAQGCDIHLAPGQERHLPHEAWHVVQQKQGRVRPTLRTPSGVMVNDDHALEREADALASRSVLLPHRDLDGADDARSMGGRSSAFPETAAELRKPTPAQTVQCKWIKTEGVGYSEWDQLIEDHKWYRQSSAMGYQYSREPKDRPNRIKIFLSAPSWGNRLPDVLSVGRKIVFGTEKRTAAEIREAFHLGYRIFDTAHAYHNIASVAEGLKGSRRSDYEVIYKLEADEVSVPEVRRIAAMFGGYLDVAMLHNTPASPDERVSPMAVLRDLRTEGVIRKIGAGNAGAESMDDLRMEGVEMVQNNLDAQQSDRLREKAAAAGLSFQGYGLGYQAKDAEPVAKSFGVSPMALLLAWAKRVGITPVVTSGQADRRAANADAANEHVPEAAVMAWMEHRSPRSEEKTAPSASAAEMPEGCRAFMKRLAGAFLGAEDSEGWNTLVASVRNMKFRMKLFKDNHAIWFRPAPASEEVNRQYVGKPFGQLIKQIPDVNSCNKRSLYIALVAASENIGSDAVPFEDI